MSCSRRYWSPSTFLASGVTRWSKSRPHFFTWRSLVSASSTASRQRLTMILSCAVFSFHSDKPGGVKFGLSLVEGAFSLPALVQPVVRLVEMRPCAGARDLIANLIQGTVCLFEKEDQGVSEGLEGLNGGDVCFCSSLTVSGEGNKIRLIERKGLAAASAGRGSLRSAGLCGAGREHGAGRLP